MLLSRILPEGGGAFGQRRKRILSSAGRGAPGVDGIAQLLDVRSFDPRDSSLDLIIREESGGRGDHTSLITCHSDRRGFPYR